MYLCIIYYTEEFRDFNFKYMKIKSLAIRLAFVAVSVATCFSVAFAQDSSVKNYLWEEIERRTPENKFSIIEYGAYEPTNNNVVLGVWMLGGPRDIVARRIREGKNENNMYELTIIMPYLTISRDTPAFQIYKNDEGVIYYPKTDGTTKIVDPVSGERYELERLDGVNTAFDMKDLSFFMVGPLDDHKYKDSYGERHKLIYNVRVTLEFPDENFEHPKFVTFDYNTDKEKFDKYYSGERWLPKNGGKPMFIGTLAQTSKEWKDNPDPYGGWNTWVPFEADKSTEGYPYTYTFKPAPGQTEYDLAIYLEVTPPKPDGYKLGDALIKMDKEFYPYLAYWSADYEWTHNLYMPGKDIPSPNILDSIGVSKAFPGGLGPGQDNYLRSDPEESYVHKHTSIRLTKLDPNKVYRLTVGDPMLLWWYIQDRPKDDREENVQNSRYHFADALAWVNLMEYTPKVKAYQLVEYIGDDTEKKSDDGKTKTYYTFDAQSYKACETPPTTYKVVLDKNEDVVSCVKVTDIDEETEYKSGNDYMFTDMLFVRTEHPDWMYKDYVDVEVTKVEGTFFHKIKDDEEVELVSKTHVAGDVVCDSEGNTKLSFAKKIINKSEDEGFAYSIVHMKGVDNALDTRNFTLNGVNGDDYVLEGYSYKFRSNFELDHKYQYMYYVFDENGNLKKENGNAVYDIEIRHPSEDTEERENPYRKGKEDDTQHYNSHGLPVMKILESTVGNVEGWTNSPVAGVGRIGVPTPAPNGFGDDKSQAEISLSASNSYVEKSTTTTIELLTDDKQYDNKVYQYTLTDKNLHSHEYDVKFPYLNPNATPELLEAARAEEDTPYMAFEFAVKPGTSDVFKFTGFKAHDVAVPGYYLANMNDIYNNNPNGSRTLTIFVNDDKTEGNSVHTYRSEGAYVPYNRWDKDMVGEVKLELEAPVVTFKNKEMDGELGHIVYLDKGDVVIYATLNPIENTNDYITDQKTDGQLTTGDEYRDYTTLYLVEFNDIDIVNEVVDNYKPDDIKVSRLDESVKLLTYEELNGLSIPVDVYHGYTSDKEGYNKFWQYIGNKVVKPVKIRNVYIFPKRDDGLTTRSATKSLIQTMSFVDNVGDATYYGVTTPISEPLIGGHLSSVIDAIGAGEPLAVSLPGAISILADDVTVYGIDGSVVAKGMGEHSVLPGVYVAGNGRYSQKLIVR